MAGSGSASGAVIDVPAGALTQPVPVAVTVASPAEAAPPATVIQEGPVLAYTPHGVQFAAPVTISVPFSGPASPGLDLFTTDGVAPWQPVPGAVVSGGVMVAQVSHFSYFMVGWSTVDVDGDGVSPAQGDCDDADPAIFPGAAEVCDGLDNDCNGAVDDAAVNPFTFYRDGDGDGVGDVAASSTACSAPAGYVAVAGDCDDTSAAVHPGAAEACNGRDDDCDGQVDEGTTQAFYRDVDGDGHGTAASAVSACSAPAGYVALGDDCDDTRADVHPGATELCDGIDHDCNGKTSTPTTSWTSVPGLPSQSTWLAADAAGNTFAAGYFAGTLTLGGVTLASAGDIDIFVAKFDATGHLVWARRWGSTGADWVQYIASDAQGGLLLTGSFEGSVDFGGGVLTSAGLADGFVLQLDAAGNHVASRRFGGVLNDQGRAIAPAPSGGHALAGTTGAAASGSGGDGFVAMFDAAGAQVWTKSYLGIGVGGVSDVAVDALGNVIVAGIFQGMAVAKYAPDGTQLWIRTGNGGYPTQVAVDGAGNVVMAGQGGVVYFGASSVYTTDASGGAFVIALDAAGGDRWALGFQGSYGDPVLVPNLAVDATGRSFFILDTVDYIALGGTYIEGPLLAVVDQTGASQWSRTGTRRVALDPAGGAHASDFGTLTLLDDQACQRCPLWYRDADGDGHGDPALSQRACAAPAGYAAVGDDCDDTRAAVHPGAPERCNGVDDDCDGNIDDGAVTWANRYGNGGEHQAQALAVDAQGNSVVGGRHFGSIDFGNGPVDVTQVGGGFLAKLDAAGQEIWAQPTSAEVRSAAVDAAGDVVFVTSVAGGCGGSVTKLDPAGNTLWTRSYPWSWSSCAALFGVAVNGAGQVVLGGNLQQGPQDFGGGALSPGAFVVVLDAAGNHVSSRSFGATASYMNGAAAAIDGAGNAFLSGSFRGTVDFGLGPVSGTGNIAFLVALGTGGNTLWQWTSPNTSTSALAVDAAGHVYVAGSFGGTVQIGGVALTAAGIRDGNVAGFDGAGAPLYARALGAPFSGSTYDLATDGGGNVVVGWDRQTKGAATVSALTGLDAGGVPVWQKTNAKPSAFMQVAVDPSGNVVTAGTLMRGQRIQFGTGLLTGVDYTNVVMARFAPVCLP